MARERAGAVAAGSRSSNARLLAVGVAVLVIGVILVLIIIRNTDDPAATPAPVATQTDQAGGESDDGETLTPEQLSTARLPLPLDVPEGTEAIAVRANFMRSVAAIPAPGDRVSLYRLPAPGDEDGEAQQEETGTTLPDAGPDAELVLTDSEVLAVTGPLPASNDGTITLVVAVPTNDVAGVMPVANTNDVWFTLLPSPEEEGTEQPTDAGTEEDS